MSNNKNNQMSYKTSILERKKNDSIDKDQEKTKSFTNKIVNKISNIDGVKEIESSIDKSSNVNFITFGLFALIGFIVIIYAILVEVVADTVIQSANVFFVVTIISIYKLVGTLVYIIRPVI